MSWQGGDGGGQRGPQGPGGPPGAHGAPGPGGPYPAPGHGGLQGAPGPGSPYPAPDAAGRYPSPGTHQPQPGPGAGPLGPGAPRPQQYPPGPPQGSAQYPGQPGQPSYGHPQQPVSPKKRSRLPIILGVIAGVLVLALVAFALAMRSFGDNSQDLIYHPQGSSTYWLDSRYAEGYHTWSFDGRVLGVSQDRSTVGVSITEADEMGVQHSVAGLDILTGQEVWRIPDISCDTWPFVDGSLYCMQPGAAGTNLVQIDLNTGSLTVFYEAPFQIRSATPIGVVNGNIVISSIEAEGERLLSFSGNSEIAWQTLVELQVPDCQLLGGTHIGCSTPDQFTVLDAATGAVTLAPSALDASRSEAVLWATDGYVIHQLIVSSEPTEDQAYDFTGQPLDIIMDAGTPLRPSGWDSFFYPLDDIRQDGYVSLVDAQGTVVVTTGGKFWPDGVQVGKQYDTTPVIGSADGQVVLLDMEGDNAKLFSRAGEEIAAFDVAATDLGVVAGLIIGDLLADEQVVYAPGRG